MNIHWQIDPSGNRRDALSTQIGRYFAPLPPGESRIDALNTSPPKLADEPTLVQWTPQ